MSFLKYICPFLMLTSVLLGCGGSDETPEPTPNTPEVSSSYTFNGVTDRTPIIIYIKSANGSLSEINSDNTNIAENSIFNEHLNYYRDTILIETDSIASFRHADNPVKPILDEENAVIPFSYDLNGFHFTIEEDDEEIIIDGLGNLESFKIPYDFYVIDNVGTMKYKEYGSSNIYQSPFDVMQPGDTMALMQFNRSFVKE